MPTDAASREETPAAQLARRRAAVVLAHRTADGAAPPGIDPSAFGAACLVDVFEVLDDLVGVATGVAGLGTAQALLGPVPLWLPAAETVHAVAVSLAGRFDELVVVPADVPDLPGLVLAKVFRALLRNDLVIAPDRAGAGAVAVGVRLPWPEWVPVDLDLDGDPGRTLHERGSSGRRAARAPEWHRLRHPADVSRLDPRLEGWEQTRALLSGQPLGAADG